MHGVAALLLCRGEELRDRQVALLRRRGTDLDRIVRERRRGARGGPPRRKRRPTRGRPRGSRARRARRSRRGSRRGRGGRVAPASRSLRRPGRGPFLEERLEPLETLVRAAPLRHALNGPVRGLARGHRGDGPRRGAWRRRRPRARRGGSRRSPSSSRRRDPSRARPRGRGRRAGPPRPPRARPSGTTARACDSPILRTRYGEMTAGMIPMRTSVVPKTAFSAATTTSQAATRPVPPPSAAPCTRATTGLSSSSSARKSCASSAESRRFSSIVKLATRFIHSRSAPAQNAGPSPESSTTRTLSSDERSRSARCSSDTVSPSQALRTSGRLRTRRATRGSDRRLLEPDLRIAHRPTWTVPGRSERHGHELVLSDASRRSSRRGVPSTRPPDATAPRECGHEVRVRGGDGQVDRILARRDAGAGRGAPPPPLGRLRTRIS